MEKKFLVSYRFDGIFSKDVRDKELYVDVENGVDAGIIYDALISTIQPIYSDAVTVLSWSEIKEAFVPGDDNIEDDQRYHPHMYEDLRSKVFDLGLNEDMLNRVIKDRDNFLEKDKFDLEKYTEMTNTLKGLLEEKYNLMYAIKKDKYCTEELYKKLVNGYNIDESLLV